MHCEIPSSSSKRHMAPSGANAHFGTMKSRAPSKKKGCDVETPLEPTHSRQRSASPESLYDMLPELRRLDLLLEQAVARVPAIYGVQPGSDPLRGFHITETDAAQLFAGTPGSPVFSALEEDRVNCVLPMSESTTWLGHAFGLTAFDLDVVLLALSPELDRRYEKVFGYLNDDVSRRRPTVDLALNLFCRTAEAKLSQRDRFAPNAPLVQNQLIRLFTDPHHGQPPLLMHYIKLDEQIVNLLLSLQSFDSRLAPFARLIEPALSFANVVVNDDLRRLLRTMAAQARAERRPLRFYFQGSQSVSKFQAAEALASEIGRRLLVFDLRRLLESAADFAQTLPLLFREAWFKNAILYIEDFDSIQREERGADYNLLLETLSQDPGISILCGTRKWVPTQRISLGVMTISFPAPEVTERRSCWQQNAAGAGLKIDETDLNRLAEAFRLSSAQIAEAVAAARNFAMVRSCQATNGGEPENGSDLFAAARAQSAHNLAKLAIKIDPLHKWPDIVLPADTLAQLHEVCQRAIYFQRVFADWGFDRKLSLGKGTTALFSGPSGTGKTMAAEIIANELELELYRIDLSMVISKYIGETEKNLNAIFQEANDSNAILFFDEADALFGKRSEVKDAHDRYANIEVAYLLQKMDEYEGIVILATNLRNNMDEAFTRRIQAIIDFPFPEEECRRQIFEAIFPEEAPLDPDIDFDFLARQFKLSGGNIKNIALHAAFLAAADDKRIGMAQIIRATKREFQKIGRLCSKAEFGRYYDLMKAEP